MEYRGYDSAGVSTHTGADLTLRKGTGRLEDLQKRHDLLTLRGSIGIGHTRWATHGGVTEANAHPHASCGAEVAIVHNGIIENYSELKRGLQGRAHQFRSETDSEVIAHLLEEQLRSRDPLAAVLESVQRLCGAFAFLALFQSYPRILVGARQDAPLVVGVGGAERFVASDVLAFIEHTDRVIFLENMEVVVVSDAGHAIHDFQGRRLERTATQVAWESGDLSKKEFRHYTLKEIHEQPETVKAALYQEPERLTRFARALQGASKVYLVGAGTSYHASLLARYWFTRFGRLPVEAVLASEFAHQAVAVDSTSAVLAVSQSGETADVLQAVRLARDQGASVLSLVNVMGSSLVRDSDLSLQLNCGPEIGVAATKSYTAQLAVLYQLMTFLADANGLQPDPGGLSRAVQETLQSEAQVRAVAQRLANASDLYFIGRGSHFPVALEGALKVKELAYIHAEGLAAGELKHGTLALVEHDTPTVVLNPHDETYTETLSNAEEIKARGGFIVGVSDVPNQVYDAWVPFSAAPPPLLPLVEVIPLQLLAYYCAVDRRQNPDYPRNLAKSVTVK
jgi:glucosamine--fructose-6-phosphate aminotransferase (isomerizing)